MWGEGWGEEGRESDKETDTSPGTNVLVQKTKFLFFNKSTF